MGVGNSLVADDEPARAGVDDRVWPHHARIQRRRDEQRLHRRTRFESVGHRAIAQTIAGEGGAAVRIEPGCVGHRQNLAGTCVQHHDGTGFGAVQCNRIVQLAIRHILDVLVQRERQVASGFGRLQAFQNFHHVAGAILHHALGAGFAGEPGLVGQLQAFLAIVFDVGDAEDVAGHFAARVIAAVGRFAVQTNDLQRFRLFGLGRFEQTLDVNEAFGFIGEQTCDLVRFLVQDVRQRLNLCGARVGFFRIHPQRFDRRADCQRFAAPVGDHAAIGGDGRDALGALLALVGQEIALPDLQIDRARRQRDKPGEQQAQGQARAPALQVEAQQRMRVVVHGCPPCCST